MTINNAQRKFEHVNQVNGTASRHSSDCKVIIIGGGGTGAAVLLDLTMRGFDCTLIERGELTSGTTGRHHGQLHSGARYAVGDIGIARECIREVRVLNRIAPDSIEMNYGVFLALTDEDAEYSSRFIRACSEAGIPNRKISTEKILRHEPAVNPDALFGVVVPDGTIDAYRLPMRFFATAHARGAEIRRFCEVTGVERTNESVGAVTVRDHVNRREERLSADVVVNAAGPWSGAIAAGAGIDLPLTPAAGTMVAVDARVCNMVISHLHPSKDGDIIVPQRRLSVIGSTERETDDPEGLQPPEEDVEWLLDRACDLVPGFRDHRVHAAWSAARPLAGRIAGDGIDRSLSRNLRIISHAEDGFRGFYSVIGGKATVLRAMGEAAADAICSDLGIEAGCSTADTPLLSYRAFSDRELRESTSNRTGARR